MTITIPGMYDMPDKQYHADPCETPSLSAGMITQLLSAPAKCYEASSRLNPHYIDEPSPDKFSLGTVRHVMFLEPHIFDEKVCIIDADDWRTKEAKTKRDNAKASGRTPILAKHMEKVHAARAAFYRNEFTAAAFMSGKFEQSLFWKHPVYGFWCRARPDFIHNTYVHLCDYKATGDANPASFGKHAYNMGYHRRAAWYLEGCQVIFGKRPDHYWYVNQENDAPYLTSVCELDINSIEAGQNENDRAAKIFARCLEKNEWPGYRHASVPDQDMAFQVGLPNWAYVQIDMKEY